MPRVQARGLQHLEILPCTNPQLEFKLNVRGTLLFCWKSQASSPCMTAWSEVWPRGRAEATLAGIDAAASDFCHKEGFTTLLEGANASAPCLSRLKHAEYPGSSLNAHMHRPAHPWRCQEVERGELPQAAVLLGSRPVLDTGKEFKQTEVSGSTMSGRGHV